MPQDFTQLAPKLPSLGKDKFKVWYITSLELGSWRKSISVNSCTATWVCIFGTMPIYDHIRPSIQRAAVLVKQLQLWLSRLHVMSKFEMCRLRWYKDIEDDAVRKELSISTEPIIDTKQFWIPAKLYDKKYSKQDHPLNAPPPAASRSIGPQRNWSIGAAALQWNLAKSKSLVNREPKRIKKNRSKHYKRGIKHWIKTAWESSQHTLVDVQQVNARLGNASLQWALMPIERRPLKSN